MTILPNRPVTVNVRRSGGLLGRAVEMNGVLPPGSPAHAAGDHRQGGGAPQAAPTRSRDGFADRVLWNPGPHAALGDVPPGGPAAFVCIEAAQLTPVTLARSPRRRDVRPCCT